MSVSSFAVSIANGTTYGDFYNTSPSAGRIHAGLIYASSNDTAWKTIASSVMNSNYAVSDGRELIIINNLYNQPGQWLEGVEVQFGSNVTPASITVSGATVNGSDNRRYLLNWTNAAVASSSVSYSDGSDTYQFTVSKAANTNIISISAVVIPDTTPPTFTSNTTASVAENQTSAIDIDATDVSSIVYSISGGDASLFNINSSTGVVSFISAPDFENPTDADANNTYAFTVTAKDSSNNSTNQSITVTVTDVDEVAPILSSSVPADNASNVSTTANIVLVFNEPVDAETGNILIRKSSDNSIVETIAVTSAQVTGSGTNTITIDPSVTFINGTSYYVTVDASAFDDALSNSFVGITSSTMLNFSVGGADPISKSGVIESVRSWTNTAQRNGAYNIRFVNDRLEFLHRNQGSENLSYQGVKFHFSDEHIDFLMNGNAIVPKDIDSALDMLAQSDSIDKTQEAEQMVTNAAKGILLAATEGFVPNLNPTGGEIYGVWSGWTAGEVTVGNIDAPNQKVQASYLSIGMDKPISGHERIGFAFSIADDDVDVGSAGSFVKSNNYGFSTYGSYIYPDMTVQGLIGYGSLNFNTKRIDGAQTLTGSRKGGQIFTSVTMRSNTSTEKGSFLIAPYGRLDASYTQLKAFTEAGGTFALTHNKQNVTSTSMAAGVDITSINTYRNGVFRPYAKFEIVSDKSGGSDASMYYSSATSTVYSTEITNSNSTSWKVEVGSDIFFMNGSTGSVFYRVGGAGSASDNSTFGLRLGWSN